MAKRPQVGELAPDFTLPGVEAGVRRSFTLSAERGRPVVLAFYPGDNTTVCTKQLCAYQNDLAVFRSLDAAVWGISPQGLESHESFADKRGLTMPLLADTKRVAHKLYGADGTLMTKRALFVVDAEGLVRWARFAILGMTYEDTDSIASVLRELDAA